MTAIKCAVIEAQISDNDKIVICCSVLLVNSPFASLSAHSFPAMFTWLGHQHNANDLWLFAILFTII